MTSPKVVRKRAMEVIMEGQDLHQEAPINHELFHLPVTIVVDITSRE